MLFPYYITGYIRKIRSVTVYTLFLLLKMYIQYSLSKYKTGSVFYKHFISTVLFKILKPFLKNPKMFDKETFHL